jgi:ribokinase
VRVAVVGHVEWVEFVRGDRVPAAGQIAHAEPGFEEPAGGGGVAAVQLARLAGGADLFTALGDDDHAARSRKRFAELGVNVHSATRDVPTRRAFTFVDERGERTITTIGERLTPRGDDPLDWDILREADGVYLTAGDVPAISAAREARVLVATPRTGPALAAAGVRVDALVFSDEDEYERGLAAEMEPRPDLLVATRGAAGGRYERVDGGSGTWPAVDPPGPVLNAYGSGDTFAAALTYGLAAGDGRDQALALAARASATTLTGRGPYERQLSTADLAS